ncbi:MAG: hypothetical protein NC395_03030 [Prevotella sp.]|nr:hypothetical protein [Prevotella sp.]
MTCPKSVRTAAIVSQVFIVAWAVLSFFASVYQKPLLSAFFLRDESVFDDVGKVSSWSSVAFCLGGLLFTAANLFMCTGKGKAAPVAISAAVLGLLPIAAKGLSLLQNRIIAVTEGADKLTVWSCYNAIASALSYLLFAGAVITVAAAAVYAYAKNRENEESGESYTEYDMRYNVENG